MALGWHCVVSRPQQEARAAVELANQGFRVFLPILDQKPMFPRYLFSQFDSEKDPWGAIKSTRGCVDLLKNGFTPASVPDRVIEAIMAYRPRPIETPCESETDFRAGDTVRITEGPLAGLSGLFVADKRARTACLLDLFGKKVEVPRDSLRAA